MLSAGRTSARGETRGAGLAVRAGRAERGGASLLLLLLPSSLALGDFYGAITP